MEVVPPGANQGVTAQAPQSESVGPSALCVPNNSRHLRRLLTDLYVAVLAYIPVEGGGKPVEVPEAAWDAMMTSVLDAAEGRPFVPLTLPWPPVDRP